MYRVYLHRKEAPQMPCLASTLTRQHLYQRVANHFAGLAAEEKDQHLRARLRRIAKKYAKKVLALQGRGKELKKKKFFNAKNGQTSSV